jgi:hypothetical protein
MTCLRSIKVDITARSRVACARVFLAQLNSLDYSDLFYSKCEG